MTQEQLGNAAGLSRIAIGQIETGGRAVSSIELDRIAYALGRDLNSFFAEEFVEQDPMAALFRTESEIAGQEDLLNALRSSLALGREMTNLEHLLGIDRSQPPMAAYDERPKTRWDAIQQGQRVADHERKRLGLGSSPAGDLVDMFESQGIRTGSVSLPDNISGLTLANEKIGVFVVINHDHAPLRRRFSLAHEYAHVLLDRDGAGAISKAENREDLLEVRANVFAANFLMPKDAVVDFVRTLGKGGASREQVEVYDGDDVVQVEQRAKPGSQDIQLHDVILIARHFGVSRITALYRLKNLKMIDRSKFQCLKEREDAGEGKNLAAFLAADDPEDKAETRDEFRHRFLWLALEAHCREEISLGKFIGLARMVGIGWEEARGMVS